MAKKKGIDMGDPGYNQKDWEAHRWCIRNKGVTNTTPVTYGKNDIWIKIFEYCKYYYEKHKHRK